MIQAGDTLPEATLFEMTPDGPQPLQVGALARGRRIVIFGLPGAFTPTCSAKHLPGYVSFADRLKAKGVDEIVCLSVNDAFVMGAWGKEQGAQGKVRMLADGNGDFCRALGLELDLRERGMGVRCQRFSMLVEDGVVKTLNVEAPGKFEVSDAETMLAQLDRL
ncbi:peroxiredoxin [Thiobacter aerophilum]|uniref:Glutathione-dependent peroxiredoxin n=1 Tax=Thiobacter aerophilum TaxID=3121275 RepID=A0ABV0EDZ4_9BURK